MEFKEFNQKSEELIEKIKSQNPLAIVRFGSSIREEDFIPEASDLDMIVISDHPISTENDLGFENFPNTSATVLRDFATANPFILNAINNGQIVYDPKRFLEGLVSLQERGLQIRPTENTFYQINQSIGNQLSSAMNRYFLEGQMDEKTKIALLRNLDSTIRGVSVMKILSQTGKITDGYTPTYSTLKEIAPDLASDLRKTRENLRHYQNVSAENRGRVNIGQKIASGTADDLGSLISDAEGIYLRELPQISSGIRTNDLIDHKQEILQQNSKAPLERTLAVRIDNGDSTHLILGTTKNQGYLFGLTDTNQEKPNFVSNDLFDSEQIKMVYQRQLGIFR